jgi:hypothetical protein
MAKVSPINSSDNEGSPNGATSSAKGKANSKVKKDVSPMEVDDEGEGGEEGGEEESEYEIEAIIDAKRGSFPEVGRFRDNNMQVGRSLAKRVGSLHRAGWATSSSGKAILTLKIAGWMNRTQGMIFLTDSLSCALNIHFSNADDLIAEYWKTHTKTKKAPRKSVEAKTPKRPRKSAAPEDGSDRESASVAKKRGRKPQAKADSDMETGKDNEEAEETRAPKRLKKNGSAKEPTVMEVSEIGDMKHYMSVQSWESLIESVDTIEREDDGTLTVYFAL